MLLRLSAETTAICFPGGAFGLPCLNWLEENGIPYKAFEENCVTRSGSVIRAPGESEISILGLDSHVSAQAVNECLSYLSNLPGPYVLAICGVIPDWESDSWKSFREWLPQRDASISLVVDTYGPGLEWFIRQSPDLVKINRDELEMLFDSDVNSDSTDQLLGHLSEKFDCPHWFITNGPNTIWSKSRNHPCASYQPRKAHCVSPIGCGDIFFATLLDGMINRQGISLKETIRTAAEYASRNAESKGIADFEI